MNSTKGCREEVIAAARALHESGADYFTPADIVSVMRKGGSDYPKSTISAYVCCVMSADEPQSVPLRYTDLERIGRGRYRLRAIGRK
jgi:hypothetical protein